MVENSKATTPTTITAITVEKEARVPRATIVLKLLPRVPLQPSARHLLQLPASLLHLPNPQIRPPITTITTIMVERDQRGERVPKEKEEKDPRAATIITALSLQPQLQSLELSSCQFADGATKSFRKCKEVIWWRLPLSSTPLGGGTRDPLVLALRTRTEIPARRAQSQALCQQARLA